MRALICLLLFLPANAQELNLKPLMVKLSNPPASRPGFSTAMRRGTWFDALQEFAQDRGVDIYRDGVVPLLR